MRSRVLQRALLLSVVLVLAVAAAACGGSSNEAASGVVTGSGVQKAKDYDFSGFTSVRVDKGVSATVRQGDVYAVSASTNENAVQYLKVTVEGDTLVVGLDPSKQYDLVDAYAEIVMPDLASLEVTAGGDAYAQRFAASGDVALTVSGAAQLNVDGMHVGSATVKALGGGKLGGGIIVDDTLTVASEGSQVTLLGRALTVGLTGTKGSIVSLKNVVARTVNVVLTDASKASVRATKTVNVAMAGASGLDYYGPAKLGKTDITGASQLSHIEQ